MASNDNRGTKTNEKLRDVTRYLSRPRLLAYLKKGTTYKTNIMVLSSLLLYPHPRHMYAWCATMRRHACNQSWQIRDLIRLTTFLGPLDTICT
jgi:hypothetical protein